MPSQQLFFNIIRYRPWFWIIALAFVACNPSSDLVTSTLYSSPTSVENITTLNSVVSSPPITKTSTETKTATYTPEPVFVSTPVPLLDNFISADNAKNLTKLAQWGRGQANYVTYSPDGKTLGVASATGIYLYDAKTLIDTGFIPTIDSVNGITFSPDNTLLVGTFERGAVRLWNVADGSLLRTFEHDTVHASGNALFSPDGTLLFSGSGDGAVRLWRISDGKLLRTFRGGMYDSEARIRGGTISLSPDGSLLATTDNYNDNVWVWRTLDGTLIHKLQGNSVAFSPDGKILTVGIIDDSYTGSTVKLWKVTDWKLLRTLGRHEGQVNIMKYSPDGKKLITNDTWGTAKIWSMPDGKLIKSLQENLGGSFISIDFSPDGTTLASISNAGRVRVREISDDENVTTLFGFMKNIHKVVFSPDNTLVATGDDWSIQIWRASDGTLLHNLDHGTVSDMVFSPDGKILASGTDSDGIRLWDMEKGSSITTLDDQEDIKSVAFSPNGKFLAAVIGGYSDGVQIWDVSKKNLISTLETGFADKVTYSPNGDFLAVSLYNTVQLWQVTEKNLFRTLPGNSYAISDMEFSRDGSKLLVTGDLNSILWDINTGKQLEFVNLRGDAFSPDSTILTSFYLGEWKGGYLGWSGRVVLWQYPSGKQLNSLKVDTLVSDIEYSPNNKLLAIAFRNGTLQIWGVK